MKSATTVVTLVLLAGIVLLVAHLKSGSPRTGPPGGGDQPPPPVVERPLELEDSASCEPCHPDVYREWYASWHRRSYTDPEVQRLSDGFKDKDCLPCHLPEPLFETGLGVRVLERSTRHAEGVGCFTCHKFGNAMLGTNDPGVAGETAPCNPRQYPPVADTRACAPCHDQHKVHQDWAQTRFAVPGSGYKDCNDCHMPVVERRRPDGTLRTGRSHLFGGGHDEATLAQAATLTVSTAGPRQLLVEVKNTGAGHHFPADYRHRAVDLQIELRGEEGWSDPVRVDRYRNPYRDDFHLKNPLREPGAERDYEITVEGHGDVDVHAVRVPADHNPVREEYYPENTQIPAGEARSYTLALPGSARVARVRLWYRLNPFATDEESTLVLEEVVELDR